MSLSKRKELTIKWKLYSFPMTMIVLVFLGGAVVTRSSFTAMAWVRLQLWATCEMSFTLHVWWFSLRGFVPPSEGLKIVPIGTVS